MALTTWSSVGAAQSMMFVIDGSNSMWGRIGEVPKITLLREAMDALAIEYRDLAPGLVVYGHRREGDCDDVETLLVPGVERIGRLATLTDSLTPTGKTPLALAFQHAVEGSAPGTTIVLISDGIENCRQDPCAAVSAAAAERPFTLHTIGFGIEERDHWELYCMANAGGGSYWPAADRAALENAVRGILVDPGGPLEEQSADPESAQDGVDFDSLF